MKKRLIKVYKMNESIPSARVNSSVSIATIDLNDYHNIDTEEIYHSLPTGDVPYYLITFGSGYYLTFSSKEERDKIFYQIEEIKKEDYHVFDL